MLSKLAIAGLFAGIAFGAHAQTGATTPSTKPAAPSATTAPTDGTVEPQTGKKMDPGTTGAMQDATKGIATSPQDVKAQTEGRPTAADAATKGNPPASDVTTRSPGTVGAAPGSTGPMPAEKKPN